MNYFFIIVILALGGGVYYEYSVQHHELVVLGSKVDKMETSAKALNANIKSLEADKVSLTKSIADANASIPDLTKQLEDSKKQIEAMEQVKKAAEDAKALQTQAEKDLQAAMNPPPSTSNKLGTIATLNGKTYQNCRLTKVEPDDIIVSTSTGFVTILYPFLPGVLQKEFGYDSQMSIELTAAQVNDQESIRVKNGNN